MSFPKFKKIIDGLRATYYREAELKQIYRDLKGEEIKEEERSRTHYAKERELATILIRGKLKCQPVEQPYFYKAESADIVRCMFDLSWISFSTILKKFTENNQHVDHVDKIKIVTACLSGYKAAMKLTCHLGLTQERDSYADSLARFSYIMNCKNPENLKRDLVTGRYLQGKWYKEMQEAIKKQKNKALLKFLSDTITTISEDFHSRTHLRLLGDIQRDLRSAGGVDIVHRVRRLIKQGYVDKLTANSGKWRQYRLYLFNDMLMYALRSPKNTYEVHRLVLLAYCSLENIKIPNIPHTFRVKSPQKTFILSCKTKEEKHHWMKAIQKYINERQSNRSIYLSEKKCRLCLKNLNRRLLISSKKYCESCLKYACDTCFNHKINLKKTRNKTSLTKICDGCYGDVFYQRQLHLKVSRQLTEYQASIIVQYATLKTRNFH